jgi:iduronate 2-sulfatase
MLTGLRPSSLGIWNLPTHLCQSRSGIFTLPQHFRNKGYFTDCDYKISQN